MSEGRKRTKITIEKRSERLAVLRFEDMVIDNGKGKKEYLHRLRYVNVPTVKQIKLGLEILAGRDSVVRSIYEALEPLPDNHSKLNYFYGMIVYFRYLDSINYRGDVFVNEIMKESLQHFNRLRNKGEQVSKSVSVQSAFSFFLRAWSREKDLKTLPEVFANPPSKNQAFDIETELKPLAKVLIRGALAFQQAIEKGELLDTHPFFDEEEFEKVVKSKGWKKKRIDESKRGFKQCMKPHPRTIRESQIPLDQLNEQTIFNQASRNWFFVFSMLTGMNKSVLAQIRFIDVRFKNIGSGRFVLCGRKSRANYKELDNSSGFSKRTKELIEGWLMASKTMYLRLDIPFSKSLPICPFFNRNGEVSTFDQHGAKLECVNLQIQKVTGLRVTTMRFRATKSDILMRVTDDIFLVSQGLNNSISVVAKRYSSGVQVDHDNNLNATFSALDAVSKGEEIGRAIEDAKVMRSDILSDYDYKKLRSGRCSEKPLMMTPSGVSCSGPTAEKLVTEARRMKQLGIDFSKDTGHCTDFIGCFDCDSHKLVSSEDSVWLMLSFLDQIEDLKEIVASNSTPKDEYFIVEGLLKKVLARLQSKDPVNYHSALKKVESNIYHPFYQDRASASQFFSG